jgi:hypothetical protein
MTLYNPSFRLINLSFGLFKESFAQNNPKIRFNNRSEAVHSSFFGVVYYFLSVAQAFNFYKTPKPKITQPQRTYHQPLLWGSFRGTNLNMTVFVLCLSAWRCW